MPSRKKKSQVSMEFMGVMTVMFIIFTIFITVIAGRISEFRSERHWTALKDVASYIESEVKVAAAMEDGYARQFSLPKKIDGKNYTVQLFPGDAVNINKSIFQIRYLNFSIELPYSVTVPLRINGSFLTGNTNTIKKKAGWVCLNKVNCP